MLLGLTWFVIFIKNLDSETGHTHSLLSDNAKVGGMTDTLKSRASFLSDFEKFKGWAARRLNMFKEKCATLHPRQNKPFCWYQM